MRFKELAVPSRERACADWHFRYWSRVFLGLEDLEPSPADSRLHSYVWRQFGSLLLSGMRGDWIHCYEIH